MCVCVRACARVYVCVCARTRVGVAWAAKKTSTAAKAPVAKSRSCTSAAHAATTCRGAPRLENRIKTVCATRAKHKWIAATTCRGAATRRNYKWIYESIVTWLRWSGLKKVVEPLQ